MDKNRLMMIVAVIAGLLSMALAFMYLQRTSSNIRNQESQPVAKILVAMRDIPANTALVPEEDLIEKDIPARDFAYLAASAVSADEFNSLEGVKVRYPIAVSMPLLYSHLTEVVDLTISPGARAMTINVSDAGGLGGLLVPGDRVDVVVTRRLPKEQVNDPYAGISNNSFDMNNPQASINAVLGQVLSQSMGAAGGGGEWIADIIVSNVKVLAIGTKLSLSRQQFLFGPEESPYSSPAPSTVTLELTTEQALSLTGSTGSGSNPVTLLLRPKEIGESASGFQSTDR